MNQTLELNSNQPNFIGDYYLENMTVVDQLLDYFQSSKKLPGVVINKSGIPIIEPSVKKSLNVNFEPASKEQVFINYQIELQKCILKYIDQFKFANWGSAWTIRELTTIQGYEPNDTYFEWHCERLNASMPMAARHLVFMTYLNTVEDAGETEFYYQKIKIKPLKGRTLIWPADWTHTHRGVPSPTENKIIITGWLNYC